MDGGAAPAARRREVEEQGNAFHGFMRWLTGAY
jgi:E3 ubiquitin-protein ligase ATL4